MLIVITPIRWRKLANFRTSKTFFINSCWDRKRERLPEFWPRWSNLPPTNWKKLFDMKKRNTLSCLLWVFCLCDKTKTPFRLKNSWNRQIILMPVTVWQVLNMKLIHLPETEMLKYGLFLFVREITLKWNIFLVDFSHLEPLCALLLENR